MSGFDIIRSVTDNLQTVLKAEGINFVRSVNDDSRNIPSSLLPLGRIFYSGESFDYSHGQGPRYAEAGFVVRIILAGRDPVDMMRVQQKWVHRLRGVLTVSALNAGELAATKPVSRLETTGVDVENRGTVSTLIYGVKVRYREL